MIFFNPEITVKEQNGVYDFTCDVAAYNQVTVPVLYHKDSKCQKIYVGMEDVNRYFNTPFFPVRLQCYYDAGEKCFFTTGYISQDKIFLPNNTLEIIIQYCRPLLDLEPLDKNKYGNNLKSKLAMYGYNVRKDELSQAQRYDILDFVIKNHFMTPMDVIHLLDHHVSYIHNWYAQRKWKNDIEYVRKKYLNKE